MMAGDKCVDSNTVVRGSFTIDINAFLCKGKVRLPGKAAFMRQYNSPLKIDYTTGENRLAGTG